MSDQVVTLIASDGTSVTVDIVDDAGPFNTWSSRTPGAWSIESGTFTNATATGHARGCGMTDCWWLDKFDIDDVGSDSTGSGENNDAGGSFPVGKFRWKIG